jgi:hypothetical protein
MTVCATGSPALQTNQKKGPRTGQMENLQRRRGGLLLLLGLLTVTQSC